MRPAVAVGGDGGGQSGESGDGRGVGRDGRQEVWDGERVAGDLDVAVHVRKFLGRSLGPECGVMSQESWGMSAA